MFVLLTVHFQLRLISINYHKDAAVCGNQTANSDSFVKIVRLTTAWNVSQKQTLAIYTKEELNAQSVVQYNLIKGTSFQPMSNMDNACKLAARIMERMTKLVDVSLVPTTSTKMRLMTFALIAQLTIQIVSTVTLNLASLAFLGINGLLLHVFYLTQFLNVHGMKLFIMENVYCAVIKQLLVRNATLKEISSNVKSAVTEKS